MPSPAVRAPARVARDQKSPKNSGTNNVDAMPPQAIAAIRLINGMGFRETYVAINVTVAPKISVA